MRLLLLASALYLLACDADKIAQLEKENKELQAKLGSLSQRSLLDLQEKCATQARIEYNYEGWSKKPLVSYFNHYNRELNKCFIAVYANGDKLIRGELYIGIYVSDAFEGKNFGEFYGVVGKPERSPVSCMTLSPTGEETFCHSKDEFDVAIKRFME